MRIHRRMFLQGSLLIATGLFIGFQESAANEPTPRIPLEAVTEIKAVASEILSRFPPDQYSYVGLGRSPTPILAYLESIGMTDITHLPFSNSGRKPLDDSAMDQVLFPHFERALPESVRTGKKKILLMDFIASGDSLETASAVLDRYLRSKDSGSTRLEPLGLYWDRHFTEEEVKVFRFHTLKLPPRLAKAIGHGEYKSWSKFAVYQPWKFRDASGQPRPADLSPQPEYEELKSELKKTLSIAPRQAQQTSSRSYLQCLRKALGF